MNTAPSPNQPAHPINKTKVQVRSIAINQAEGITGQMVNATVCTFAAANALLARICAGAPTNSTYHKTDFKVTWADDESYSGRFDARAPNSKGAEPPDLALHVRRHLEFLSGYRCPDHMDQATYEHQLTQREKTTPGCGDQARHWLKTYSLADDPTRQPAQVEVRESSAAETGIIPERTIAPTQAPKEFKPAFLALKDQKVAAAPKLANYDVIRSRLDHMITGTTLTLQEMEENVAALHRSGNLQAEQIAKEQSLEVRKALAALIRAKESVSK